MGEVWFTAICGNVTGRAMGSALAWASQPSSSIPLFQLPTGHRGVEVLAYAMQWAGQHSCCYSSGHRVHNEAMSSGNVHQTCRPLFLLLLIIMFLKSVAECAPWCRWWIFVMNLWNVTKALEKSSEAGLAHTVILHSSSLASGLPALPHPAPTRTNRTGSKQEKCFLILT